MKQQGVSIDVVLFLSGKKNECRAHNARHSLYDVAFLAFCYSAEVSGFITNVKSRSP